MNCNVLYRIADQINPCADLLKTIEESLDDEPAVQVGKGKIIRDGFNKELDELRAISGSGKDFLDQIQERESERTGIQSLKIGFNNVFGYYIEVRNTHKDKVPEEWIWIHTLVNAERYITDDLKEDES